MYESREPLMEVKPQFIYWPAFITRIPLTIFMTIWGAGFCGGFSLFGIKGLEALGVSFMSFIPPWFPFLFFGLLFFIGVQFWSINLEQKTYEKTVYKFYPEEIIYYEGFWTIEEKSISYRNILEVSHQKGVFQQQYGLGTVKLMTAAAHSGRGDGILIKDIPDSENVYRFLKEHINKVKESAAV